MKKTILWCCISLIIGMLFGWCGRSLTEHTAVVSALRESDLNANSGYRLIDPLIGLKNTIDITPPQYQDLQSKISLFINSEIKNGDLQTASVYFRDIEGSGGITIGSTEQYSPASLLKVPTMIAYYKLAETDPSILTQKLYYNGSIDLNAQEHIISPIQLQKSRWYTVEELIEHMIKYSDNNAATMLVSNLNTTGHNVTFNTLFSDLGIDQVNLNNDFITIKAYSLFFRVLYNSTYLNRTMSEKALALMTESDFSKGIDAGVPNNITVSQKFGEFTLEDQSGNLLKRELHNCGIVYYPHNPYLLCIMTKGNDFTKLEGVINNISRMIYESIEKQVVASQEKV